MGSDRPIDRGDSLHVEGLLADLDELITGVSSKEARAELEDTRELVVEAHQRGLIESSVKRVDINDAAEALFGSIVFASPLLVEDGVFDIAEHLLGYTVLGVPVFLVANTVFVVFMTYALLEWTGRAKAETRWLFGVIPTRLVMILVISFAVSAILMIVWGRVGDWQPPAESIARINVLWAVGSLGAALGDLISNSDGIPEALATRDSGDRDPPESVSVEHRDTDRADEGDFVTDLHDQFATLEAAVEGTASARDVRAIRARTQAAVSTDRWFDERIQKYTSRDVAEAFVGSVFFSIPLLVEDGVFDVAEYFLSFRVGSFPVFFILNAVFVFATVSALVYWAGPQHVRVSRPLFGLIPRRLVGITVVSFVTVMALMTMWGRVGGWAEPLDAIARVSAVWTVASFGAALGDILPGESSGADINDAIDDIGDQVEGLLD